MTIKRVKVFGRVTEIEVEFYYEKPESSSGYRGGYEIYKIDGIPSHFFTEEYMTEVVNRLEELRHEE